MNASKLRYRIAFKTQGEPDIERGLPTYVDFYKCFADAEEKVSAENLSQPEGGRVATLKTIFTIRRNPTAEQITPTMAVEFKGEVYDILPGVKTLTQITFEGTRRIDK